VDGTPVAVAGGGRCTEVTVMGAARAPGDENCDDPIWRCQLTQLYDATTLLPWWDVRQYVRDVTSGNHKAGHMIKLLDFASYRSLFNFGYGHRHLIALYNWFQKLRGGRPFPLEQGMIADGKPTPSEILDLRPGEWVEVRSQDEILATITKNGFNRGMRYDMEMAKMMQMKNPCIQLEDIYCRAECTSKRIGCPRASNTYWREIWLRRVDGAASSQSRNG
jgi:hypothetical protein